MTQALIRKFVKNAQDLQDPQVRGAYGNLASVVSILCNLLLFAGKFAAGTLFGSVAIAADAMNNLSDASSNVVSLLGFKLAAKPADRDHPYGHGRFEYLAALTVAVMVVLIGFELGRTSLDKILHPTAVIFSWLSVAVLVLSIVVKLWMAVFNRHIGKLIGSSALEATADDSRNDVISTGAVLIATLLVRFTTLPLDGWMGLAVAAFILYSGAGLIKETVDPLLGQAPDPELVQYIQKKALSYPGVLGVHDLMVHDYGPGRRFASLHLEMPAEGDVMASHDLIDNIEQDFLRNDGLHVVIHYDPIVTSDSAVGSLRRWLAAQVKQIDPELTIHDLRTVPGPTHTNVIFDCVVPPDFAMPEQELHDRLCALVKSRDEHYICVPMIESSFASIPHTKADAKA